MQPSILKMEIIAGNCGVYQTIFKTRHGRVVYLALAVSHDSCVITQCFYVDRNQRRTGDDRYAHAPKKLQTMEFPIEKLLSVLENQLDKKFYQVEWMNDQTKALTFAEYMGFWKTQEQQKYRFLVMVGQGETYNGLPGRLRTRLKNRLHRSIYIDLAYRGGDEGVVNHCYYYDRRYSDPERCVTPPMLIRCFFSYTKEGILQLINHELYCNFTHMIVTDGIDLDDNITPLCGAI